MLLRFSTLILFAGLALGSQGAAAGPAPAPQRLVLKDHRFTPSTLIVPARQKIQVLLLNQDGATEEFDSRDLNVEELVTPNGQVTLSIGPLKPGAYAFMGEFHPDTAQGHVVAVEVRP